MKIGSFSHKIIALTLLVVNMADVAVAAPKKTLTVGVVLRLNDRFNSTVAALDTGIDVAKALFEEQNPGIKINLKRYSVSDNLASAVAASDKIIADKIQAVVGGEYSEESIVLGERLGDHKIVFITPTASSPLVTENRPYAFRACFSDNIVAEKLAHFMVDKLKPKSIGMIHNLSSPYTDFLSKKFLETFNIQMSTLGPTQRTPLYEERILSDNQEFTTQVDHFIENKVTHVVMLTHETDFMRFALQAANKKFFPIYLGSDGWGPNNKVFENFVKNSADGSHFIAYRNSYWKEDSEAPMAVLFKGKYEKQIGHLPSAWSAVSFDAAWVLFNAMKRAKGPVDGEKIQKEMKKIRNMALVTTEHFSFGPDNSPIRDLHIYRIDRNGINYEATLK